jgi:hypothetical protein
MTVSDSGGLTWTQQSFIGGSSGDGYAGIWTAVVPGGGTGTVTQVGTPGAVVATSGTNTGSVTGSWSGTQPRTAGDLLVAFVTAFGTTSATTISTPSGWTQVLTLASASGQAQIAVYAKVATGSDAAPAFTATMVGTMANSWMTCELIELTGQSTVTPVGASGTAQSTTSPLSLATSGNVPSAGCYALAGYNIVTSSVTTTTVTPGSGWALVSGASTASTSARQHAATDFLAGPPAGSALTESEGVSGSLTLLLGAMIVVQPPAAFIAGRPLVVTQAAIMRAANW